MTLEFFRKHVVVVIGAWNQNETSKGHVTGASVKQIVQTFEQRRVPVYKIDEFRTSMMCHLHIAEYENGKIKDHNICKNENTLN